MEKELLYTFFRAPSKNISWQPLTMKRVCIYIYIRKKNVFKIIFLDLKLYHVKVEVYKSCMQGLRF